jgi:hypothetical protein
VLDVELSPGKQTWHVGRATRYVDEIPDEHGDFPPAMFVYRSTTIKLGIWDSLCTYNIYTYNIIICMYIHIIWDNPEELSENLINHDTS